jgi:hypothetical protein
MNDRPEQTPASEARASAGPAPAAPSSKPKSNNERWDEDEEPWRHPPVAPVDESPLDSLGRAVSDVIVGATPDRAKDKPKP